MAQYLIRARLNLPFCSLSNATASCGRLPDELSSHDAGLPIKCALDFPGKKANLRLALLNGFGGSAMLT